jgi:hypothetical protein
MSETKRIFSIVALAMLAAALPACGGGSDRAQAGVTATPSAAPSAPPATPDPSSAVAVMLTSATIVGTPTPENMVPVRVIYKVRVDAPNGISAAYGSAALPFSPKCDAGAAVPIEQGPLPHGATVERNTTLYCDPDSAKSLESQPSDFFSMHFTASSVTYPTT